MKKRPVRHKKSITNIEGYVRCDIAKTGVLPPTHDDASCVNCYMAAEFTMHMEAVLRHKDLVIGQIDEDEEISITIS